LAINKQLIKQRNKKMHGFTMPEVLISIGLFTTIMAVTSAAFLTGLRSQRQTIASLNANDNLAYALEMIARDIRMGTMFFAPLEDQLSFLSYDNKAIVYRLNDETIERSKDGGDFEPMTAQSIRIKQLAFILAGEKRYDEQQIKITIRLKISSKFSSQEVVRDLQTTISPRNLETSAI
jgi:prepilin-type N-terminal cleavage/methylation domain-containing protein